jgi:hypothetical protein
MHKWLYRLLGLGVSAIVGFTIGYAMMSYEAVAASPVGLNLATTTEPFAKVFAEMARLGEAESVFRGCRNVLDLSSERTILKVESQLIGGLRSDAKSAGLAPPLDLAEAVVQLRRSNALHGSAVESAGVPERAMLSELIGQSGWPEGSEEELREALAKIDTSCK